MWPEMPLSLVLQPAVDGWSAPGQGLAARSPRRLGQGSRASSPQRLIQATPDARGRSLSPGPFSRRLAAHAVTSSRSTQAIVVSSPPGILRGGLPRWSEAPPMPFQEQIAAVSDAAEATAVPQVLETSVPAAAAAGSSSPAPPPPLLPGAAGSVAAPPGAPGMPTAVGSMTLAVRSHAALPASAVPTGVLASAPLLAPSLAQGPVPTPGSAVAPPGAMLVVAPGGSMLTPAQLGSATVPAGAAMPPASRGMPSDLATDKPRSSEGVGGGGFCWMNATSPATAASASSPSVLSSVMQLGPSSARALSPQRPTTATALVASKASSARVPVFASALTVPATSPSRAQSDTTASVSPLKTLRAPVPLPVPARPAPGHQPAGPARTASPPPGSGPGRSASQPVRSLPPTHVMA